MTEDDVIKKMLELALWLVNREDDSDTIELKVDNLNMKFVAWVDGEI